MVSHEQNPRQNPLDIRTNVLLHYRCGIKNVDRTGVYCAVKTRNFKANRARRMVTGLILARSEAMDGGTL
jgi:hypothetical protein